MAQPIVTTTSGKVRGSMVDGVCRFYGVPYAAPPVGALRFQKPARAPSWSGERDATETGATAPQAARQFPGLDIAPILGTGWRQGDDYLTASIWTPDPSAKRLPVMAFIHGGAWVAGAGDCSAYDGTSFARNGVVLISINYRMGLEGVVPFPGGASNLCLRDMIAALQWVQQNAESFGGDPGNVTVFGESAGAMSIANLIGSPLTKGLFRRAILQSGHGSMLHSLPVDAHLAKALADLQGVSPDLAGFASKTMADGARAVEAVMQPGSTLDMREPNGRDPAFGLSKFTPLMGDDVVPESTLTALGKGAGAEVDVLIGSCLEETRIYFVPPGVIAITDKNAVTAMLAAVMPNATAILADYGLTSRAAGEVFVEAMSDLVFRDPVRHFAEAHRGSSHVFEFGWRSPALGGQLGASHALELPFVFNTLPSCTGPEGFAGENPPQDLADHVHGLWLRFAKGEVLPWAPFDASTRQVYRLDHGRAAHEAEMPAAKYRL